MKSPSSSSARLTQHNPEPLKLQACKEAQHDLAHIPTAAENGQHYFPRVSKQRTLNCSTMWLSLVAPSHFLPRTEFYKHHHIWSESPQWQYNVKAGIARQRKLDSKRLHPTCADTSATNRTQRNVHEAKHAVDHPLPSSRGRERDDRLEGALQVFHIDAPNHDWW